MTATPTKIAALRKRADDLWMDGHIADQQERGSGQPKRDEAQRLAKEAADLEYEIDLAAGVFDR